MAKYKIRKYKRSGCETCEVCKLQTPLQEHHMRGRNIQDYNNNDNLVWVCPSCHDRIHLELIILEGWFNTSNGRELIWHNKGEESITGNIIIPPKYSDKGNINE